MVTGAVLPGLEDAFNKFLPDDLEVPGSQTGSSGDFPAEDFPFEDFPFEDVEATSEEVSVEDLFEVTTEDFADEADFADEEDFPTPEDLPLEDFGVVATEDFPDEEDFPSTVADKDNCFEDFPPAEGLSVDFSGCSNSFVDFPAEEDFPVRFFPIGVFPFEDVDLDPLDDDVGAGDGNEAEAFGTLFLG